MEIAISKHRQFDAQTGEWIEGKVNIGPASSLRKLMRASRRGKVPDDRQVLIKLAQEKATKRHAVYLNSCPAKRAFRAAQK